MPLHRPTTTWRDWYNPLRGLTMARLVSMEDATERGPFSNLQWFWHHMERTDATVPSAIAMDRKTGVCVDMDRFQRLDWPIQKERILAFSKKWRGLLVMDATGAGDPIYGDLARVWPRIEPVKFTNQKKVELIQRLIVAVEQRNVSWPAAWEILTNEMKRYEYAISPNGAITYSALSGYHDDCVIALALVARVRTVDTVGLMSALQRLLPLG
jgi:hypothetical protein